MRFSSDFLEKVRAANNLVDIIGQYTQLKPSGRDWMGRCPFPDHPEKTASFSVSEGKQLYFCFGCKKGGNTFDFLANYQGMSFVEAVEYLANRAGLTIPTESFDSHKQEAERALKRSLHYVNHLAKTFYCEQLRKLPPEQAGSQYFSKRGISQQTIDDFQLGYAPEGWSNLVEFLRDQGQNLELAETAQLIRKSKHDSYFDLFRDRMMIPIMGANGDVLGFGGRIISQGEPKYLNSPESPIFHKGSLLFGLHQSAKYIRTEDQAIIVEGYMDALTLYNNGIRNVVAAMGTALTPEQAKILRRITRNVVIVFDGDRAGQEAQNKSLLPLLAADLLPRGLSLPEGQDPDDFVKEYGPKLFSASLADSKDLFLNYVDQLLKNYQQLPTEKLTIAEQLRPLVLATPDANLRELYMKEICSKMSIEMNWLKGVLFSKGRTSAPAKGFQSLQSSHERSATAKIAPASNQLTTQASSEIHAVSESTSEESVLIDSQPRMSLTGAPQIESLVLALSIKSRANFELLRRERGAIDLFSHPTLKELFTFSEFAYLQDPENFDSVLGQIPSKLEKPELFLKLAYSFDRSPADDESKGHAQKEMVAEREAVVIRDGVRKIKVNRLKSQVQKLRIELKDSATESAISKIQELQSQIVDVDKKI